MFKSESKDVVYISPGKQEIIISNGTGIRIYPMVEKPMMIKEGQVYYLEEDIKI
jgi:hypothetical protein